MRTWGDESLIIQAVETIEACSSDLFSSYLQCGIASFEALGKNGLGGIVAAFERQRLRIAIVSLAVVTMTVATVALAFLPLARE